MQRAKVVRLLTWVVPLPLAAALVALHRLHEAGVVSAGEAVGALIGPGMIAFVPALVLRIDPELAMFAAAGLVWYLAGVVLVNAMVGRSTAWSRAILVLLGLVALYTAVLGLGWTWTEPGTLPA